MATILGGLGDLGYGWAYRVLDARWFGVPQRRRRVVIVGCLGDAARAAQVLAVCESCGGYPAAREEASEDVAPTLAAGAGVAGTLGSHHGNTRADQAWTGQLVAATLSGGGHPGSNLPGRHHEDDDNLVAFGGNNTSGAIDVAASRSARGNRYDFDTDTDTFLVASEIDDSMARPLVARSSGYRMDMESENFVVANALRANQGTGRGWSGDRGDASDTLVVADPIGTREGKTYTHEGSHNFRTHNLISGVRRLTPLECERLMGFPDDWTRYAADGTPIADSHRYRMCGNGVVAVVAEWLGHRLVAVDALR